MALLSAPEAPAVAARAATCTLELATPICSPFKSASNDAVNWTSSIVPISLSLLRLGTPWLKKLMPLAVVPLLFVLMLLLVAVAKDCILGLLRALS